MRGGGCVERGVVPSKVIRRVLSVTHAHALERTGARAGLKIAGRVKAVCIYGGGIAAGAGNGGYERPDYRGFHCGG